MPAPAFDVASAHRWFAIEFNNQAWELVEAAARSPGETERMLLLAHASFLHWSEVGTPLHRARALNLLTFACALAGQGDNAVSHAEECLRLSEEPGNQPTAFDRAAFAAGMACALRAAGQPGAAEEWTARGRQAAAALNDPDEARLIDRLLVNATTIL